MKQLAQAMAIPVTLVLIVLTLGCAQPAPAALERQAAEAVPSAELPRVKAFPFFDGDPRKDQAILDDLEQATQGYIAELIMAGQPVPDYQYAALRSIEDARRALRELEAEWLSTQMVIADHIMARQSVPEYQYAALKAIESARQAVLITHGLVD